ncbi:MAG: Cysteine-tRNA ligase [Candidatus Moranbacteria bacterium GW2011_GWA2_39_41]|nr:MAG: Cysteine-tRNA ligase [Candidatus Moranbacteria bacterium GW2011_GWA2_39_41]
MLNLYNTLSRKKEEFKSIHPGKISMYVCGPTVYDHCHLGHGRGYVSMDIIRRYLEFSGYEVRYIMNYTDVGHLVNDAEEGEDKIERKAKTEKVNPIEIANKYIESSEEDFKALNIKPATFNPRPTQYIAQIIKFVQDLIKKGYAYEINGSVYFSVEKFPEYGKLSGRNVDDMISGSRVEINEEKTNPLDFALWIKATPEHILKWESPWSLGYPGWHIECSVMSCDLLGQDTFDIHGGGNENIFPHNENEIAQNEAYLGKKMANFWTLWSMVNVNGVKMSKSLGNFTTIKDALKEYSASTIRLWIASSHYRSPINYSIDSLAQSKTNLDTINNFYSRLLSHEPTTDEKLSAMTLDSYCQDFEAAMDDDLNTPKAMSVIFQFVTDGNKLLDENLLGNPMEAKKLLETFAKVLGLILQVAEIPEAVQKIAEERKEARQNKDFAKSDELRDTIDRLGYIVEDIKDNDFIIKQK